VHVPVAPGQPPYGAGYPAPGPVGPSPAAAFLRRVFTGRWEMPLLVALGPALTVLGAALAIAGAAGAALPAGSIGMATRTRSALAVLVQGLGGNFRGTAKLSDDDNGFDDSDDSDGGGNDFSGGDGGDGFSDGGGDGGDDFSDGGGDGGDDFSDGGGDGGDDFSDGGGDGGDDYSDGGTDGSDIGYATSGSGHSASYHWTVSVLPWTVTVVWVVVLVLGLRMMRSRLQAANDVAERDTPDAPGAPGTVRPFGTAGTVGAEAAVRVALLAAAAALGLGFAGEPHIQYEHFTTAPFLAALWTFVLSLVTALLVLCRPVITGWLAARPGAATAYRVAATTLYALLTTVLIAGAVVFVIALAHYHDLTGWGVAGAALMLLNLGVSGLGLAWGTPLRISAGSESRGGGHVLFGLGELDHVWGGWSVTGVVAGGLLCAVLIGVFAVRRSRSRPEQFAVAGLFTLFFVILVAVSGVHSGGDTVLSAVVNHTTLRTDVPEALGFGLLWTFGGVLVAPYVLRLFGGAPPQVRTAVHGTPGYPPPYGGAGYGQVPPPYSGQPYGGQPGGTYGAQVPPQAGPPAQPAPAPGEYRPAPTEYAPPAGEYGPPQTPAPPEPGVHDLGVVEPDRLRKRPPDHR
jgi:hypothetical protein